MLSRWLLIVSSLVVAEPGAIVAQPAKPPTPKDGPLGMKFVPLPKGTTYLGWNGEPGSAKKTEIKEDFEIAIHTVTQGQWQAVMGNNPSHFSRDGKGKDKVKAIKDEDLKQFPVENLHWLDTDAFIKQLNEKEKGKGYQYRLPSEAEWEYACRGGATTEAECSYHFYVDKPTNDLSSKQANFYGESPFGNGERGPYLGRPTKVGSYPPNKLGLHDMHGNVWQWCADLLEPKGSDWALRGGDWSMPGALCQTAYRPKFRGMRPIETGFRLVRVAVKEQPAKPAPEPAKAKDDPKVLWTIQTRIPPTQIEFSPDGKTLVVGHEDGTVARWDVDSGKSLGALDGILGESLGVGALAFSLDGKTLAIRQQWTGSKLVFWDVDKNKLKHRSEIDVGGIYYKGLAWSPDGRMLAVCNDGRPMLLDAATGKVHRKFDFKGFAASVAFSADGKRLATGHDEFHVKIWDPENGKELLSFRGHRPLCLDSLLFTPDGKSIITNAHEANNYLRYYDSSSGKSRFSFQTGGTARSIVMSADGKVLAVGEGEVLVLRDGVTGGWRAAFDASPRTFALSRDGNRIAAMVHAEKGKYCVRVWNLAGMPERTMLRHTAAVVLAHAFSPNGKWLASGTCAFTAGYVLKEDHPQKPFGEVAIWNVATRQKEASITHLASVNALFFNADSSLLISGSDPAIHSPKDARAEVRVHDMIQAKEIANIDGHLLKGISADGQKVLLRRDKWLRLWEWKTKKIHDLLETSAEVTLSPDGAMIAVARHEAVELWEIAGRKTVATLKTATLATRITFSPDGKALAVLDCGIARVWNTTGERKGLALPAGQSTFERLRFSVNGQSVAVWNRWEAMLYSSQDGKRLAKLEVDPAENIIAVDFGFEGHVVAIVRTINPGGELGLRSLHTGNQLAVFRGDMEDFFDPTPELHPDGRKLAFADTRDRTCVTLIGVGSSSPAQKPNNKDKDSGRQPDGPTPKPAKPKDGPLGMKFVPLPKGTTYLGWNGKPGSAKKTEIKADFEIAIHTVTQGQWQALMGNNPSYFSRTGGGKDKVKDIKDEDLKQFPVEMVSWQDAQAFLQKLNEKHQGMGYLYRLPSAAEWEYACRGGATSERECSHHFYFEQPSHFSLLSTQANFDGNDQVGTFAKGPFLGRPTKVGSYVPNKLGLYDMHGNVWQWTATANGADLVYRGGSWLASGLTCIAAFSTWESPMYRSYFLGFRVVRVAVKEPPAKPAPQDR